MRQPGYAWSVFSVYDNIVPSVHGELREWSFVDREVNINRPCDLMRYFPYCRKGWLHKCVVAYLLDRGKIQWEHIKFSFQPTTLLPADAFKNPIDTIVEAWMRIPEARAHSSQPDLAKLSVNAAIGAMCCRDEAVQYMVTSSLEPEDVDLNGVHSTSTPIGDGEYCWDYIRVKKLLMLDSVRPIWEQIMNIEYLRLAQLRDLICEVVPQKAIRQCRTDCWLVSTSKKKVEEFKRHLKD